MPTDFPVDSVGISTVLFDSVAVDTLPGIPHFISEAEADSLRAASDTAVVESVVPVLGSEVGVPPLALNANYTHGSGMSVLFLALGCAAGLLAPRLVSAVKAYRTELWSVRKRANVFDEEASVNPVVGLFLMVMFVVFGGIVLYNLSSVPHCTSFIGVAATMALLACYYLFRLSAYWLLGFTFGSPSQRSRWVGGFLAAQAYTSILLAVPAILLVYCPQWHKALIITSLSIYFAFRLIFVAKGFRIFFTKYSYSLYFILYLCSIEIIPVLALYRLSTLLPGWIR